MAFKCFALHILLPAHLFAMMMMISDIRNFSNTLTPPVPSSKTRCLPAYGTYIYTYLADDRIFDRLGGGNGGGGKTMDPHLFDLVWFW